MFIPHSYSVIAVVDKIHRKIPYVGGRLALADVFDAVPGLLLAPSPDLPHGTHAAMTRESGCVQIVFDPSLSRPTQRFAIAHEIGHALLHAGHLQAPICDVDAASMERQADFFAQELLAPLWAIDAFLLDQAARYGQPDPPLTSDFFEIPGWLAEQREDACARFYGG